LNILGSSLSNEKKTVNTVLMGAAFVVPAVFVTQKHVDMYSKNDKENRGKMRNKMLGFFVGVGVSVALAHQKIKSSENKNLKEAAKILGVFAAPFLGLEVSKQINNQFYA